MMQIIHSLKELFNQKSIHWAANYPKFWSLGWLTQLLLSLSFFVISFLLSWMIPVETMDTPSIAMWFGLAFIPCVFWWGFIIYRLVKFNSEKLFGDRTLWHNFIELPSYFFQLAMPLIIPFTLGLILTFRVAGLVENERLDQNMLAYEDAQLFFSMDYGEGYLNSYNNSYSYGDMHIYFENDSQYIQYIRGNSSDLYYDDYEVVVESVLDEDTKEYFEDMEDSIQYHRGVFEHSRPKLYPNEFSEFYLISKSIRSNNDLDSIKMERFLIYKNDDKYIRSKFDALLSNMKAFGIPSDSMLTSAQLFDLYSRNIYNCNDDLALRKQVMRFDDIIDDYTDQLRYILKAKERNLYFLEDYIFIFISLIIIFGASIILCLFKNMSWKEFLIGLVVLTTFILLNGIIFGILRIGKENFTIVVWIEFLILTILSVIASRYKARTKLEAMLLMVPHLFIALLPIAILGTLDVLFDFWHWEYFDQYLELNPTKENPLNRSYNSAYYELKFPLYRMLFYIGCFVYAFLIYPLWLKVQWLKFMAKPMKS